jgi:toxin ParE1/3/4
MKPFLLSPAAVQDLEEIAVYVASERPSAVPGILDAIESACQLLADYPSVGRARREIDEEVLSFPMGSYVLFYYVNKNAVGIARILHASRDLPTAFHSDD